MPCTGSASSATRRGVSKRRSNSSARRPRSIRSAANAFYNRACLLQKLNRPDEALGCFDRAIAIKPDYLEALVNRSMVLAGLKRHDAALASLDKVVALRPNIGEAWNNRGAALFALGRLDEAVASYDRAVALKPDYAEAWKNRAIALLLLQRADDALSGFDKATTLAPRDTDTALRRADLLFQLNRHRDAARAYETYLALKPDDAHAWNRRGSALQQDRRLPDALACYDKAIALAPGDLGARLNRGQSAVRGRAFRGGREGLSGGARRRSQLSGLCHRLYDLVPAAWLRLGQAGRRARAHLGSGRGRSVRAGSDRQYPPVRFSPRSRRSSHASGRRRNIARRRCRCGAATSTGTTRFAWPISRPIFARTPPRC